MQTGADAEAEYARARAGLTPGTAAAPDDAGHGEGLPVVLLSLAGGLALLALALWLLSPLAPAPRDLREISAELVSDPTWLRPEPLERFRYVAGLLLLPFCLGAAYLAVRFLARSAPGAALVARLQAPLAWSVAPLGLAFLLAAGLAERSHEIACFVPGGWAAFAVAAVLAAALTALRAGRHRDRGERAFRLILPLLSGVLFLGILLFSVIGPEHIRTIPIFMSSFNAFFHSVVQVYLGKELLVNLANQYGLYPHFLEPVFRLTGLSVSSLSILMGLLTCAAFWCFHRFLVLETGDRLLAFVGLSAAVFTGYVSGRAVQPDLYFQFHPLRVLFPALSILAARAYARDPVPRRAVLLFALGAAGFLWNPDTGLVVFAAAALLVGYDALLRRRPLEIPARLLLGAAAAAGVVGLFSLLLWLRFGAFPDYSRLFSAARAFYYLGAGMLPMPPFGVWAVVGTVYAAGLLLALIALARGEQSPRARLRFYLSVLGAGVFSYYQGRSVLGNLAAAGYPAILLLVLFADDTARQARPVSRGALRLQSLALLAVLLHAVPALAAVAPVWVAGIADKVRATRSGRESDVLRDARFLRHYLTPGGKAVIVSGHSGLYHLVTGTTSPLDVPGSSEIVYARDLATQREFMRRRQGFFVIDRSTMKPLAMELLRRQYGTGYDNPYGTLVVFPPR